MTAVPHASTQTPPHSQPKPARRYIKDLGAPERVAGVFSISNAQLGKTRQDKSYLRCILGDKTGEMPGRMWSIEEATYKSLPVDGFVYIEGETQPYQGEMQCIIQGIEAADPSPEEIKDLLPTTTRDIGQMFARVQELLASIKHPAAQMLAKAYLDDEFLMQAFRQAPAAKSMHHAYLGGLLEHTVTLLELANVICPLYPKISRDVVMLGLFLHDLAKTRELVYDRAFAYSERGELIGHIVDGAIMLHDKAQKIMRDQGVRLPHGLLTVLQHVIISHHAEPEFGAAKVPATPEALLVAMIDNLDAKTHMTLAAARPDRGATVDLQGNFTDKQWALNGVKLYRPDPLL